MRLETNNDEFDREIIAPLVRQEQEIGLSNIHNYKMCAICLNYIQRDEYSEHMEKYHGYSIVELI